MNTPEGHRERLRSRFLQDPTSLSEAEILELLLTYTIPRRDVAPLARSLINDYGSIRAVLMASESNLSSIDGIGEATVTFLRVLGTVVQTQTDMADSSQLKLFNFDSENESTELENISPKEREMRVFANDEIANSLNFIPQAAGYKTLDAFKQFLYEKLPYNARETRLRRARNIVERFYPDGKIDTPLTFFASTCSSIIDLKPAIFYHALKAEPIVARAAEELIYPALPIGKVNRTQLRELVLRHIPGAKAATQTKILQAIFHTYQLCGVGQGNGETLHINLRAGSLEGFLYVLTSEYPEPGIYSYDMLYQSPIHRWLLWDRDWIRRQFYNLRDIGILSKVSEIDAIKQFTISVGQSAALRQFFAAIRSKGIALREAPLEDRSTALEEDDR